jgi:transcriptional regulator with XRE-family HTH domain
LRSIGKNRYFAASVSGGVVMAAWQHNSAVARIKTAMIEKKMTQAELADAADCHEKTIQNLLNGRPVRDQTLFDVCMVLGLDFDEIRHGADGEDSPELPGSKGAVKGVAPVHMGAYTRAAVDHYMGSYLTLRPSFSVPGTIIAYRTDISWDEEWPSLLFQERDRPDAPYSHRGRLYIPASSMFIHLVSLTKGAMRMVLVSQLDRLGQMRGLITTLNKQRALLVPVAAPIVYVRRDQFSASTLGEIKEGAGPWREYRQLLTETVEAGYARLVAT